MSRGNGLIDTHIHVGQFDDRYVSPSDIHHLMARLHVDRYAVSSTSQCADDYERVLREMTELVEMEGDKVWPVMWITPDALNGNIAWYLESDIKWRMIKIHPFLNKTEWNPEGELLREVLDIARELCLPLLIHTGNDPCCRCDLYEGVINLNPDITFILAHGRPIDSALRLTRQYANAYVDTAFMPIDDMKEFVDSGLSEKLLWGTDLCIPRFFNPDVDLVEYYTGRLDELKSVCNDTQYRQISCQNAETIFYDHE